jgi:hypothetical protein
MDWKICGLMFFPINFKPEMPAIALKMANSTFAAFLKAWIIEFLWNHLPIVSGFLMFRRG